MNGEALYARYTKSLYRNRLRRWNQADSTYYRTWPEEAPLAWPFLKDAERGVWNDLAKNLAGKLRF